jgi:NAD(P)-dependent dehydrogenase (short-subunit alcohol dehydrogenase family)
VRLTGFVKSRIQPFKGVFARISTFSHLRRDREQFAGPRSQCLRDLTSQVGIAAGFIIVEAVVYLTEARYVTGEVLHVDGGAHSGKWSLSNKLSP